MPQWVIVVVIIVLVFLIDVLALRIIDKDNDEEA